MPPLTGNMHGWIFSTHFSGNKSVETRCEWVSVEMTEYIAWHEGQENLERMKTRVNKIPRNQAPCPWSRFGRSSKKEKWRYNVLHDIIQHFNSKLKQRRFELEACRPKVRFLHPPAWAVFCRAVWCPNFRGKRSIKTISNRNLGFMTFLKKDKGLTSY